VTTNDNLTSPESAGTEAAEADRETAAAAEGQNHAEPNEGVQDNTDSVFTADEATGSTDEPSAENPLAAEVSRLQQQLQDSQERNLRAQADFDNFRRRSRQEKEEFAKYASAKLIEQLLPVVDNFERAIASSRGTKDFDSFFKGVEMISRQLEQVLEQEGLKAMETVGQPFNPEFHQAIMQVESADHEEGTVVEELVKGYVLKDKVLRPAMVKVSS
jgi:molecular chaperone GrpE